MAIAPLPNRRSGAETAPLEVEDEVDTNAARPIADAYALGWLGQLKDAVEEEVAVWQGGPPVGPEGAVPAGYEAYADAYAGVQNQAHADTITRNIDENLEIRARRDARGFGNTLFNDLVAGIIDPLNLVPVGQLVGAGVRVGAARGLVQVGGLGAASEVARTSIDDTATTEEAVAGVAGSLVLGTAIGGGLGAIGRSAARTTAQVVRPSTIPPPVRGVPVTSRFGRRRAPRAGASTNHRGVDFATPEGTPVVAHAGGTVVGVTPNTGAAGVSVRIDFGGGVETRVMHLSKSNVAVGDRIAPGQIYALTGNTGNSTGPHLHYEMLVNGKQVDPFSTEAFEAMGVPAGPVETINALEGMAIPPTIDIDGRGVRVVVSPTGTGAAAAFVRGKTATQVIDDVFDAHPNAAEAAENPMRAAEPDSPMVERSPSPTRDVAPALHPFEAAGAYPKMPVAEFIRVADELAAAEGLTGSAAKARSVAIRREMREHFTGKRAERARPADLPAVRAALIERSDAAYARGDAQQADELLEQANALLERYPGAFAKRSDELGAMADRDPDIDRARQEREAEGDSFVADRARRSRIGASMDPADARAPDLTPDQIRAAMRSSGDEPEIDQLPFGMDHTGSAHGHVEDGDHIRIDVEAILASFPHKPWTQANMEGVTPLADDAFENPGDWLNFVTNHEVEHTLNPRREGESLAEYENRINARAYEMTQAGKVPFGGSTMLEKLAYAPTPRAQLERLVPDGGAEIHRVMMELADDFAVQTARHRAGGTHAAGGSVLQKRDRWMAHLYPVRAMIRRKFLSRRGIPEDAPRWRVEAAIAARRIPVVGKRLDPAGQGETLDDFRREVGRAIVGLGEVSEDARAAAQQFNKVMQAVEAEGRELGLFPSVKGLLKRAERLEGQARRMDAIAKRFEGPDSEISLHMSLSAERMRSEASDFRALAEEPIMPYREENYFPRSWDTGQILAREDEFKAMLRRGYVREGHPDPDRAAQGAFETITLDPQGSMVPGSPSSVRHRTIPVTNAEAWEFIVQDPELLLNVYLRRMGSAIEMTRQFGDPFMLDTIDVMRADLLGRGMTREATEKAIQLLEDARDRIVGGFHGKSPLSWDNRAARAIKGAVNLTIMGGVLTSQIGDIGRIIARQGLGVRHALGRTDRPAGIIGGVMAMHKDLSRYNAGGLAKMAGEAFELVTASANARMIEADDALIVTRDTKFERGIAKAQTPFFIANGMIPFTVIVKEAAAMVSGHNIMTEARALAAAIRDGGVVDEVAAARLRAVGIDSQDAQILADMPTEKGESGLTLMNVEAWTGERGERARALLLSAVHGEVRGSVVTPGPLDRPAIFDGVFHTKKGRDQALQAVREAESRMEGARDRLRELAKRKDDDPEKVEALERFSQLKGEWTQARRNVGRGGRIDQPLASLPFQVQSFAMAAGPKLLHHLLSNRDRARLTGIMSTLSAGALITWLRAGDSFEYMDWDEFIAETFDNSGVGAWLGSLAKNVDTIMDAQMIPGNEFDADGKRFADELSGYSPSLGVAANLIEPFVSAELEWDERVSMVRRSVPFANLLWLRGVTGMVADAVSGDDAQQGGNDEAMAAQQDGMGGGGRFGMDVPDLRTDPATLPSGAPMPEALQGFAMPDALPTKREVRAGIVRAPRRRVMRPLVL